MREEIRLRGRKFALAVIRLAADFIKNKESYIISNQLIRSATSIGANLAEAYVARSRQEFRSINNIALRESEETKYWLELARDAYLADESKLVPVLKEVNEICKILASIVIKCKN